MSSKDPSPSSSLPSSRSESKERSGATTPQKSVPVAAVDSNSGYDQGKLRTFLNIIRKFIGVADLTAIRFSLPAQVLEPVPNLEYWTYLDRPETFASIGDSDEALGRMLNTLRFWFTKDLKYVKGKVCKPYNSVLGEFFRCTWEVDDTLPPLLGKLPPKQKHAEQQLCISYLTEQTSHHPPVSAYWLHCPEKGISARGIDQIAGSFTGTRIKIAAGEHNRGIFIKLHNFDEEYNLTHPTAHLGGLFKGSLSISVADYCYVSCPQSRIKVILSYLEEGWVGKNQYRVQGVVFQYDPKNDTMTKPRDVPESAVLARIEGNWQQQVYFTLGNKPFDKSDKRILVDLDPLMPESKTIPPEADQLPNESRTFWAQVTEAMLEKQYGKANQEKQAIEERQREKAAERKARNAEWSPRFFVGAFGKEGRPELTDDGRATIEAIHDGNYHLEPNIETAA